MARARWAGQLESLIDILSKHITHGRCITYPESLRAPITSVERKALDTHQELLKDLAVLQRNLSFRQSDMVSAMKKVGETIGVADEHLGPFSVRYSLRLRA
eukprot:739086-Amphidinium_carterae.1